MPDLPARALSQNSETLLPIGLRAPIPVTTTCVPFLPAMHNLQAQALRWALVRPCPGAPWPLPLQRAILRHILPPRRCYRPSLRLSPLQRYLELPPVRRGLRTPRLSSLAPLRAGGPRGRRRRFERRALTPPRAQQCLCPRKLLL